MKRSSLISAAIILVVVLTGLYFSWDFYKAQAMCRESTNEALCVSDNAVLKKDLRICNTASTDIIKEGCALRAVPALATDDSSCGVLTLESAKNNCLEYASKMSAAKKKPTPATYRYFDYAQKKVIVSFADGTKKEFTASIADTDDKKIQGLSYRQTLKDNEAMLFTYDQARGVRYHMKDMLFAIDMIYANKDGKVLDVFRSLPSCVVYTGECVVYGSSNSDVTMVLEILPQGKDVVKIEVK